MSSNNRDKNVKKIESVFESDYFKLIKTLQIIVGLWPFKTGYLRLLRRCIVYFFLSLTLVPFVNGARVWCGTDIGICCENLIGIFYLSVVILKFFITILFEVELKSVYEQIAINWLSITDPEEQTIMIKYAELGKLKALVYYVYMALAGVGFTQLPMVTVVLDFILPLNESREKILFVKGEFIIDPFKHYYELYVYFMIVTLIVNTTFTSVDTTYTVISHQNLGIFSVVMHKLKVATINVDSRSNFDYDKIVEAVHLHKSVLKFVDVLERTYSFLFLIIVGATIIGISITAVVALCLTSMYDILRLGMMVPGFLVHLLYLSWPGQMILEHSSDLFRSIYTNEWYNVSHRTKVLMRIMMLRCLKPCTVTAGGLYVMNFENFGSIIKTTMSYITVAISFRN